MSYALSELWTNLQPDDPRFLQFDNPLLMASSIKWKVVLWHQKVVVCRREKATFAYIWEGVDMRKSKVERKRLEMNL
jgi:hypothetical protein